MKKKEDQIADFLRLILGNKLKISDIVYNREDVMMEIKIVGDYTEDLNPLAEAFKKICHDSDIEYGDKVEAKIGSTTQTTIFISYHPNNKKPIVATGKSVVLADKVYPHKPDRIEIGNTVYIKQG